MGEVTKIEWCDHTWNPWLGCSKVGPECDFCYAESIMADRYGRVAWGPARAAQARGQCIPIGLAQSETSAPGLPVPDSVEELRLIADGDSDAFMTRRAMTRAGKRYARPGRLVTATWAPDGADLNDVARGKA